MAVALLCGTRWLRDFTQDRAQQQDQQGRGMYFCSVEMALGRRRRDPWLLDALRAVEHVGHASPSW